MAFAHAEQPIVLLWDSKRFVLSDRRRDGREVSRNREGIEYIAWGLQPKSGHDSAPFSFLDQSGA